MEQTETPQMMEKRVKNCKKDRAGEERIGR